MAPPLIQAFAKVFRSKKLPGLNLISFWVIALVLSIILAESIDFFWKWHLDRESKMEKLERIVVWTFAGGDPGVMKENQITEFTQAMIQQIGFNDNDGSDTIFLKNADSLQHGFSPHPAKLFDKVRVVSNAVSYSKQDTAKRKQDLDPIESVVFQAFKKQISEVINSPNSHGRDNQHYEKYLASLLNISNERIVVPWIYVSSLDGAIALYPASNVIAGTEWEIRNRPWFRVARKISPNSAELIPAYVDVLSKVSKQVRTYVHKFTYKNKEFVLAIDFHMPIDYVDTPLTTRQIASSILINATYPPSIRQFVLIILFLGGFNLIKKINTRETEVFAFGVDKQRQVFGRLRKKTVYRNSQSKSLTTGQQILVGLGKAFNVQLVVQQEDRDNTSREAEIERSENIRGEEFWDVYLEIDQRWSIFWIQFAYSRSPWLGQIQVNYFDDELPVASWVKEGPSRFKQNHDNIIKFLRYHTDIFGNDDFRVPINAVLNPIRPAPRVPDRLNRISVIADRSKSLAIRQCRVLRVNISIGTLDELYTNSSTLKAVMAAAYFEKSLNEDRIEFLSKGNTIRRVILFSDDSKYLNLNEIGRKSVQALKNVYSNPARTIVKATLNEEHVNRVYDFVIFDSACVFVVHHVFDKSNYDALSGENSSPEPEYQLEGYFSWRKSDLKYYEDLFDELVAQNKGLPF